MTVKQFWPRCRCEHVDGFQDRVSYKGVIQLNSAINQTIDFKGLQVFGLVSRRLHRV